jgi:hypothetical protein
MTTLVIDTGVRSPLETAVKTYVPDWFRDLHDANADALIVAKSYAQHMVGELESPAKIETARKRLIQKWAFLFALADADTAAFDHVLQAYCQRLAERD